VKIRVGHLYPDYLNIYADRGNIAFDASLDGDIAAHCEHALRLLLNDNGLADDVDLLLRGVVNDDSRLVIARGDLGMRVQR